jgi:hypothetical protein
MNHNMPSGYERQFADFIRLCQESNANGVPNIVAGFPRPWENYEKVIENLSRPADAGLTLNIAARNPDLR